MKKKSKVLKKVFPLSRLLYNQRKLQLEKKRNKMALIWRELVRKNKNKKATMKLEKRRRRGIGKDWKKSERRENWPKRRRRRLN